MEITPSTDNPMPLDPATDAIQGSGLRPVTMRAQQADRGPLHGAYVAVIWDLRIRVNQIDHAIKSLEKLRDMRAARGVQAGGAQ